jgi:hypothetical protein
MEKRNAAIQRWDAEQGNVYAPAPQWGTTPVAQPVQRPSVVLPGRSYLPLQPRSVPGTYYQAGPGGPRWYKIQRVP